METAKKDLQLIDISTELSLQENAFLVHGTQKTPIHAELASRYSLFFRYNEDLHAADLNQPVSLLIQKNGRSLELGPCQVLSGPDINGYHGRLVFTGDVYDIESLLTKNKVIKLQTQFSDLHVLLERKEKVKSSFKEYTANLSYDLSTYKRLFDDLDSEYHKEPEEVRAAIQKAIVDTQGPEFILFFENQLEKLAELVSDFSQEEHQLHGFYFRKQLWNYLLCCPLISRSNLKPRGYPGDFEMMKMIYLMDCENESTFSKLMQKHIVEHFASQSVRNRIQMITKLIGRVRYRSKIASNKKIKVLSVGCGPAFELQEIIKTQRDCDNYHIYLLDQDKLALSEVSALVESVEKKYNRYVDVDYLNYSVRTMLFSHTLKEKLGEFHFIYSLGLFDYFAAPIAKRILNKLYQLLMPGGRLIVGNFHSSNPSRYYMEYWCDWVLIHRTEDEFLELTKDCAGADVSIFFENTGSQMFLDIRKNPNEGI